MKKLFLTWSRESWKQAWRWKILYLKNAVLIFSNINLETWNKRNIKILETERATIMTVLLIWILDLYMFHRFNIKQSLRVVKPFFMAFIASDTEAVGKIFQVAAFCQGKKCRVSWRLDKKERVLLQWRRIKLTVFSTWSITCNVTRSQCKIYKDIRNLSFYSSCCISLPY